MTPYHSLRSGTGHGKEQLSEEDIDPLCDGGDRP